MLTQWKKGSNSFLLLNFQKIVFLDLPSLLNTLFFFIFCKTYLLSRFLSSTWYTIHLKRGSCLTTILQYKTKTKNDKNLNSTWDWLGFKWVNCFIRNLAQHFPTYYESTFYSRNIFYIVYIFSWWHFKIMKREKKKIVVLFLEVIQVTIFNTILKWVTLLHFKIFIYNS